MGSCFLDMAQGAFLAFESYSRETEQLSFPSLLLVDYHQRYDAVALATPLLHGRCDARAVWWLFYRRAGWPGWSRVIFCTWRDETVPRPPSLLPFIN